MAKLAILVTCLVFVAGQSSADSFEASVNPLLEASCLLCHGENTATPLNVQKLDYDLADANNYRTWQHIYNRLERGEMPPMAVSDDIQQLIDNALAALKPALIDANLTARDGQRTVLRRLTQREYAYSLQDLLHLDETVAQSLSENLPAEVDSGGFDTVAAKQGFSALHVRSYLKAADSALDEAIQLGPRPAEERFEIAYVDLSAAQALSEAEILGGGITEMLDDAVVTYFESVSTYLFHSELAGFDVSVPGRYRVKVEAFPFRPDSLAQEGRPVVLTLYRGIKQGVTASLNDLIGSFDMLDPGGSVFETTTYLSPGMLVSPSVAGLVEEPGMIYFQADRNIRDYVGAGLALKSLVIEGPLNEVWPPRSTRELLTGISFDESGQMQFSKPAIDHVYEIVDHFAQRAFRRPLAEAEVSMYAELARPLLEDGRPFAEALRMPLRTILNSPSFLHINAPPLDESEEEILDDFQLATRLSYFLWRSIPDDELMASAKSGRLSDKAEMSRQVERMLNDPKSKRFIKDFVGQAYRLYELHATLPDGGLYPEYDDLLGQAMQLETELFYEELIRENLSVANLVKSDFTFLNSHLAQHYDVPGVEGSQMRKVMLPSGSPRGGLLSQASIHKITANGTTTSPVPRGNFVLANILGRPSPPPPPNVGGVEPDTRGTTTIREQLDAHRNSPICAGCHRNIDPPGFAMESFDPIGGLRDKYRYPGPKINEVERYGTFKLGLPVDASGITPDGTSFDGFSEYQQILLKQEMDSIARNLVSQLVTFSTGATIEFSDRDAVDGIMRSSKEQDYSMRTMIHEVVNSDLFRRP